MRYNPVSFLFGLVMLAGCSTKHDNIKRDEISPKEAVVKVPNKPVANLATILSKREVPILC